MPCAYRRELNRCRPFFLSFSHPLRYVSRMISPTSVSYPYLARLRGITKIMSDFNKFDLNVVTQKNAERVSSRPFILRTNKRYSGSSKSNLSKLASISIILIFLHYVLRVNVQPDVSRNKTHPRVAETPFDHERT